MNTESVAAKEPRLKIGFTAECDGRIVTSVDGKYDGRKVFQWFNTVIGNVKNALHGTHHAISGRHLPRYLAEFCYRFNRRFQLHTMVDWLTYVAKRTQPVPQCLLKLVEVRW